MLRRNVLACGVLTLAAMGAVAHGRTININIGTVSSAAPFPFEAHLGRMDHIVPPKAANPKGTGEIHFVGHGGGSWSVRMALKSVSTRVVVNCVGVGIRDFEVQIYPQFDSSYPLPTKSVPGPDGGKLSFEVKKPSRAQAIDVNIRTVDPTAEWILKNCELTY